MQVMRFAVSTGRTAQKPIKRYIWWAIVRQDYDTQGYDTKEAMMIKSETVAQNASQEPAKNNSSQHQPFAIGKTVPSALGSANRRVLRERAEAEALSKVADVVSERQRKSEELRRLRLERDTDES